MKTAANNQAVGMIGEVDGRAIIRPTGKVLAHFFPKEDFVSEEFSTHYMKGGRYYLREGNTALGLALVKWQEEGKVTVMEVT